MSLRNPQDKNWPFGNQPSEKKEKEKILSLKITTRLPNRAFLSCGYRKPNLIVERFHLEYPDQEITVLRDGQTVPYDSIVTAS